ncbi:MAG: hypothetical protein ABI877_02400 [Gemmatimonadaceae bacterium]
MWSPLDSRKAPVKENDWRAHGNAAIMVRNVGRSAMGRKALGARQKKHNHTRI